MDNLPYEIINQMIQCFGRCFHYKDTLESFLISAGISRSLANKYRDEHKFVWGRKLLQDLGDSEEGKILQRKLLHEFNSLRNLPDSNVADKSAGLSALRKLKELVITYSLDIKEKKVDVDLRKRNAEILMQIRSDRNEKLKELSVKFTKGVTSLDRQSAGYDLEDIIKNLFALYEIDYKKSYKTNTQQIDGCFKFEGFDYLVEAKWRNNQPNEAEIGSFHRKVITKLQSTRGIFVSINGFRSDVIEQFNNACNIILMSGEDLTYLLEGRIDLKELLTCKINRAAQYGKCYYPVTEYLK